MLMSAQLEIDIRLILIECWLSGSSRTGLRPDGEIENDRNLKSDWDLPDDWGHTGGHGLASGQTSFLNS